jgi:hypothetical protein
MKAAAQRGHGVRKNGGALDGVRALPAKEELLVPRLLL